MSLDFLWGRLASYGIFKVSWKYMDMEGWCVYLSEIACVSFRCVKKKAINWGDLQKLSRWLIVKQLRIHLELLSSYISGQGLLIPPPHACPPLGHFCIYLHCYWLRAHAYAHISKDTLGNLPLSLLPSLKSSLYASLLFFQVYTRLTVPKVSKDSLVSASHASVEAMVLGMLLLSSSLAFPWV